MVKLLARLTGNRLYTFTVNSDMDVTELLGGFQQVCDDIFYTNVIDTGAKFI